ncbi:MULTISPECIES: helix-turn-helix transcriptional regulator [Burkholderia]|jgi:prophage regulatory protein|nr:MULTISPECIES: AlpA family phage regulatory protein [Burkholderia]KGU71564.1 prophage CP4-57 regulatory family protein [Burkholderia pseudomallei MSHR4304]KGV34674.1 prophage CP4-57 regulatory family protein [Burkholderia pseudomallei MSHR4308]
MRSLTDRVGLSKSEIYRRVAAGRFPQSVKLGPKAVGWLESDIDAWITSMQDAAK